MTFMMLPIVSWTKMRDTMNQTPKNMLSIVIVLTGLFLGSLFVDIAELVLKRGFSEGAIREHEVLPRGDVTWVAYTDPRVSLTVVSDTTCAQCDPSEALVWLRRVIPTLEVTAIDIATNEGIELADRYALKTLPAFLFSKDIEQTSFFSQAGSLFVESEDRYRFDMRELGLPIGRFVTRPEVRGDDISFGPVDAPVTVVVFTDFECRYCGSFHRDVVKKVIEQYENRVRIVIKHFPLDDHPRAAKAAEAALCAHRQGKFLPYADLLFAQGTRWATEKYFEEKFVTYAWMIGAKGNILEQCRKEGSVKNIVAADKENALSLGLDATPATFVNDRFLNGAVDYHELSRIIDEELAR